jgi:dUTP pyrophosphatase
MIVKIKKFFFNAHYEYNQENNSLLITNFQEETFNAKSISIVSTGIGLEVVTSFSMDIQLHLTKEMTDKNLYMINYPATIDKDYRGELKIIIYNFNDYSIILKEKKFISKVIFNKIPKITLISNK